MGKYFSRHNADQFSFYRFPKVLFTDQRYWDMSTDAKVLYGLMLDRVGLSEQSGWFDELDRAYIYFTIEAIQKQLHCGRSKAMQLLKELEQFSLLERKHQGAGKPDRLYVLDFVESENQTAENRTAENQTSEGLKNRPHEVQKSDPIKNNITKTDFSHTDFLCPPSGKDELEGFGEKVNLLGLLHEKWGYIALRDHYTRDELDGIFSLGVDVLSSKKDIIRINGEEMPRKQVAERLLSLDFTHIDYVLESLKSVSRPVRNMRSYLLTLLYNAPITIDAYITALIAQNEAKQKERI